MGDRGAPPERERTIHWQRMRIRTVVVSFAAAVSSAHRDLDVEGAERDGLIETWRAWALDVLEGYRDDIERLAAPATAEESDRVDLVAELDRAVDDVRSR